MKFNNKVAVIITGGNSSIGLANVHNVLGRILRNR
jgi:hypothetical protein